MPCVMFCCLCRSVGCILGEILGRKPMFPGRDYMHQLHLIIEILGSPTYEDTEYIASDKAKAYIRQLPKKERIPFEKLFPRAPPLALDLLSKMLTFAPEKRINVEEALAHPYLRLLHDPADEPVANNIANFDFESLADHQSLSKEQLKLLLWNETCQWHPEIINQTPNFNHHTNNNNIIANNNNNNLNPSNISMDMN
jgi:serine/threonine protein kinase